MFSRRALLGLALGLPMALSFRREPEELEPCVLMDDFLGWMDRTGQEMPPILDENDRHREFRRLYVLKHQKLAEDFWRHHFDAMDDYLFETHHA